MRGRRRLGAADRVDKHPSYEIVNGPSGLGLSESYFPESNAVISSLAGTEGYDELHVRAPARLL